jgi:hypothetical protein
VIASGGTSFDEGDKVAFKYDGVEWHSHQEI